ncbi:hypothetical protein [Microbulbifer sp. JTAC008]|uniref:hypothetical protein n=1 Tax=Microbulbifer sp. JTAC008 TaxID=3243374 RepID=UPI004039DE21
MRPIKTILLLNLLLISATLFAEITITEEKIKGISKEFAKAMQNNDLSAIDKYMHPNTKIIIDMDPASNRGEKEISYDDYMNLTKVSMQMMQDVEIHDELISISINKESNQGTIEEKTTVVASMMGMKIEDISINKTTYGIIDGQIKVLVSQGQLISSAPIK